MRVYDPESGSFCVQQMILNCVFFARFKILTRLSPGLFCLQYCPSIKVVVLHKNSVDASVHGREVVDESALFLHRTREMVLVLHGFRDKEAGSVEAGSYGRSGVNHAWLIYPLKGAFLWMPLHSIKWVAVG